MYTGSDPDLIDLQNQITANLVSLTAQIAGLQTQIKQVTLSLEGELKTALISFNDLQTFVNSKITS
jgi:hypothetical protein